jgi:hypothetical protein
LNFKFQLSDFQLLLCALNLQLPVIRAPKQSLQRRACGSIPCGRSTPATAVTPQIILVKISGISVKLLSDAGFL